MAIQRTSSLPPVRLKLSTLVPKPKPKKDGEEPPPDDYRRYREELEEAGAVLEFRMASGREVDAWQRRMQAVQIQMKKKDRAYCKANDLNDGEADPESDQLLVDVYEQVFGEVFIGLEGFVDVTDAASAWEALLDFMPFIRVLIAQYICRRQRPSDPES